MSSTLTGLPYASLPLSNSDVFYVVQSATNNGFQVSGGSLTSVPAILSLSGELRNYSNTGAKIVAFNVQTGPTYTVLPSDAFNMVSMSGTQSQTVILPTGTNFSLGTQVLVERYGTGAVSFIGAGTVTIQSRSGVAVLPAQFSVATAILRNNTTWLLAGDLT